MNMRSERFEQDPSQEITQEITLEGLADTADTIVTKADGKIIKMYTSDRGVYSTVILVDGRFERSVQSANSDDERLMPQEDTIHKQNCEAMEKAWSEELPTIDEEGQYGMRL